MKALDFLRMANLDGSLLIGYYGGGNYGDELLLEVLQNLLALQQTQDIAIAYQQPERFGDMHHDFGFRPFPVHDKLALIKATLCSRNIIVGGGGLWGIDMNFNTLQMSIYLWICRWLLGKKVYLLGVGYYRSTTLVGDIGAWFAAKAAHRIYARDNETYTRFRKFAGKRVIRDKDLAWCIGELELKPYITEARSLGRKLGMKGNKTLFMTVRRPQAKRQHDSFTRFNGCVNSFIAANPDVPIIIAPLELLDRNPAGRATLQAWRAEYRHLRILDSPVNPLVLYAFFQLYRRELILIGPQFHIMLTAHMNMVPFLPLSYDNKVRELLDYIGIHTSAQLPIDQITDGHLQQFSDSQLAT